MPTRTLRPSGSAFAAATAGSPAIVAFSASDHVDLGVLGEALGDRLAGLRRIGVDRHDLDRSRKAVDEALAAEIEADIAELVVEAERLRAAELAHRVAGDAPGLVFALPDMQQRAERAADVEAGIDGDDRDAGIDGRADRRRRPRRRSGWRRSARPASPRPPRSTSAAIFVQIEGVRRAVDELDARLRGGAVGALLDGAQNGSLAAPCVTMTKRSFSCACAATPSSAMHREGGREQIERV